MSDKESRLELLETMFKSFLKGVDCLDDHSAVVYTNPMVDILSKAVHQLNQYAETKRVDDLIASALNEQNK